MTSINSKTVGVRITCLIPAIILIVVLLSACGRSDTVMPSTPSQPAEIESSEPEPSPTTMVTVTPVSSPVPSSTPTPTPSQTPLPTLTPTMTYTPVPEEISPANVNRLQRIAAYELPVRGKLSSAKWSRDGRLVLVSTETGTYLLDGLSLEEVHFLRGTTPILNLDSGEWLVNSDGELKYLSLEGDQFHLLPIPPSIDESGWYLLSANSEVAVRKIADDKIEINTIKTGARQTFNLQEAGYYLKFMNPSVLSPDGKILFIQDTYTSEFYVVNLETLEVVYKLENTYGYPIFSPDGQYFSITDRGGIKVIKAINGIQYNRFSDGFIIRPTPKTWVYYASAAHEFLPDSQRMGAIYCVDDQGCELYIWSMASGQAETIVRGLPPGIHTVEFSPDGESFLTLASDGVVRTRNITSQSMLAESLPFDRGNTVISSDGSLAAIPRGNQIEIFDLKTGGLLKTIGEYNATTSIMVDSVTENTLMVSGYDRDTGAFAEIWDLAEDVLVRKVNPLDYPNPYSTKPYCQCDADGKLIACGSYLLQIFDVQNGALLFSNKSEQGSFEWAISPDGNLLAMCTIAYDSGTNARTPGGQIYLLDLSTASMDITGVLEGPQGKICSPMIFSPDSQVLSAQSGYIWNTGQQQPLASFSMNAGSLMAFNPGVDLLVAGNWIIHAVTGDKLAELEVNGRIEMIGFDANGTHLIIKTDQGVEVWSVTGE